MTASSKTSPAGEGAAFFELEQFLPYRLSLLTNTVSSGIASGYRERYRISVQEWRVLAVLGRYPGLTAREITDRTAMDKVAVSRAVKQLAGKGMVRKKIDPTDRRRIRLQLTPARGFKIWNEVVPLAQGYESKLLQALSRSERAILSRLLDKLQAQANSLNLSNQVRELRSSTHPCIKEPDNDRKMR